MADSIRDNGGTGSDHIIKLSGDILAWLKIYVLCFRQDGRYIFKEEK